MCVRVRACKKQQVSQSKKFFGHGTRFACPSVSQRLCVCSTSLGCLRLKSLAVCSLDEAPDLHILNLI